MARNSDFIQHHLDFKIYPTKIGTATIPPTHIDPQDLFERTSSSPTRGRVDMLGGATNRWLYPCSIYIMYPEYPRMNGFLCMKWLVSSSFLQVNPCKCPIIFGCNLPLICYRYSHNSWRKRPTAGQSPHLSQALWSASPA